MRRGAAMTDATRHTPDAASTPPAEQASGAPTLAAAYLRSDFAPPPRTLVDIFRETVAECPDVPAIDNGATSLTYAEFDDAASAVAEALAEAGVRVGDKVGVRVRSGTVDLYVAIMGILLAGAAYVPVDADDPDERARTVFEEASVSAIVGNDLVITTHGVTSDEHHNEPAAEHHNELTTEHDAWVIFTSGSTGKPKGVAVTHRNAAAFVDAESRMFLQDKPIGVGDRVMAGLSVAFDASCEEMWLAWRYGACLVPAPRALVRSGVDLGPWLVANDVTIVSTVPTLVALWPVEALSRVRLLIMGGEACPPELAERLATPDREVWNTYGPTEATVVACGARLTGEGPVRIGLPLDGWDLAVVDGEGMPVAEGASGELIIGGVGLARYLDPEKDAEKYAPMPTIGWDRAYRSGDLVRLESEGLIFMGRADDQVKVGGRRIELGEIDSALLRLPGVTGAAAAVRATTAGTKILVGYVTTGPSGFDSTAALDHLRAEMPAAMVPRLAVVDTLPTRTSGKIDRDALPWPLDLGTDEPALELHGTQAWVRDLWIEVLGADPTSVDDDFFDLGGSSLASAELVSRLRTRFPSATVTDLYDHPRLAELAALLDGMATDEQQRNDVVHPVPLKTQLGQLFAQVPLRSIAALRWLVWLSLASHLAGAWLGLDWLPTLPVPVTIVGGLLLLTPPGRMVVAALGARLILAGITPGDYPRGGKVHLRVWLAERFADELAAHSIAGAGLMPWYARLLGATIGRDAELHSLPPVTGHLTLGRGASVDPEVDLTGHWIDGATLHLGTISIGKHARIGARSTLAPGCVIGDGAEIAAGSAVFGTVPARQLWSGAPAQPSGGKPRAWHKDPVQPAPLWRWAYAVSGLLLAALPILATLGGAAAVSGALRHTESWAGLASATARWLPVGTLAGFALLAFLVWGLTRLMGTGVREGRHPVHSRAAWAAWTTLRLLDDARTWLFPIYSSTVTPAWLRALGARIGADVEASTVLLIPRLTWVNDGAFLADDTLLGGYELGGGWLGTQRVKVGKHAFLGNSGMTAPGRRIRKGSLVAVLSAAPGGRAGKAGTSWLGSPPEQLRRTTVDADTARTFAPPRRLRVARAVVEVLRFVPVTMGIGLYAVAALTLLALADRSWWLAALLGGLVLMAVGMIAAGISTVAKWLLVGRLRVSNYPLWSSFVWRNELADTFVEVMAAPWFARATIGTPALNLWLRANGATIGRGVWCDTYWLPEADLVTLADGATVNRGCVVQTHLFHDRVLSMDRVTFAAGATLGPNGVVLPAAEIGRHATVGPASLVMRGEHVPERSRWIGNPIGPWHGIPDGVAFPAEPPSPATLAPPETETEPAA
ncbi:MAG: Pls/PosA family non-ribosomal peptide synthetase [Dermatophilaceae bacterium]